MNLYVKVRPDVKIFVEDLNSQSEHVVLFIHGWPLNHNMWEYQVEYLIELGYRCVTVDLRGYGQSDRPANGYDYATLASDIKAVIETLKLKNVTLVGHSMGAAIAIKYLSEFGNYHVSKLCLISAAAPSFVQTGDWYYGATVDEVDALIKETYSDRPQITSIIRNKYFYQYIKPAVGTWFDNLCLSASGWGSGKSLVSLRDERLFDEIAKINIPTLILHGVHDLMCPFYFGTYLRDHIKGSLLVDLIHSGHGGFFEEKDKVSSALDKFIRGGFEKELEAENIIDRYSKLARHKY